MHNKMDKKVDGGKFAVIRVRGLTRVRHDIDETLKKLKLYKKNYCVIVPKTASYLGMIRKVKDYVTWGDIDENTYNALLEKRTEEYKSRISDSKGKIKYNRFIDVNGKKIKKIFIVGMLSFQGMSPKNFPIYLILRLEKMFVRKIIYTGTLMFRFNMLSLKLL